MSLVDSIVVFAVSLLIGSFALYAGARVMTDVEDFGHAVVTALVASFVWVLVAFFLGWIPFLGPLLALFAYVGVLNVRYPGGWVTAAGIAFVAWLASLVVLYLLATLGVATFEAVGVPGV
jgi:hypothetical protein